MQTNRAKCAESTKNRIEKISPAKTQTHRQRQAANAPTQLIVVGAFSANLASSRIRFSPATRAYQTDAHARYIHNVM